ncbi:MAG: hypothetical protein ACI9ZF_002433 [Bradyrhizobium sp.]
MLAHARWDGNDKVKPDVKRFADREKVNKKMLTGVPALMKTAAGSTNKKGLER